MNYRCQKCGRNHQLLNLEWAPNCPSGPLENRCSGELIPEPDNLFDLQIGEARKAEGRDLVEKNGPAFTEWAKGVARATARLRGTVTIDDVRYQAERENIKPHHPNSWGAVFKGSEWEDTGRTIKSTFTTNNARRIIVWRLRQENAA